MHGLKAHRRRLLQASFKGPKHTKQDHIDAIFLTTRLMKLLRSEGPVALESHVADPQIQRIFAEFPRLLANKALIALICDTLTLIVVSSGTLEVHAVEEVMDNAMKTHFHEMHEAAARLQNLADALPALGIVAAVLGVVKTMGSIDKPPAVLGGMIGSALVGTFMGVLLAYGIVAPLAGRLKQVHRGGRADLPRGQAGDHRHAARLAAAAGGRKRALGPGPRLPPGPFRTARRLRGR